MEIEIERYGTVEDVPEDYSFTDLSQEVKAIKETFGNLEELEQFDSFFMKTKDGDFEEVIGMSGTVPHNDRSVFKIEWSW